MASSSEEVNKRDQGDFTVDPWSEARPKDSQLKKKAADVLRVVRDGRPATDLRLMLYVAACDALAEGRPMKPFPPGHWDTGWGCKLWAVNEAIPSVTALEAQLESSRDVTLTSAVLEALHWVLVSAAGSRLEEASLSDLPGSLRASALPPPAKVFCVPKGEEPSWSTKLGCYTGPLDQFHTLLHCGPIGLSGLTVYDSLIPCLASVRPTWCWDKSQFAPKPAMVAIIEFPTDPTTLRKLKTSKRKMYVIQDPSKCRLRYILVYSEPALTNLATPDSSFCLVRWIGAHYYAGTSVLFLLATLVYSYCK